MAKDKFDDNSMENKAVNSEDSLRVSEEVDQNSDKVENDFSQSVGLQNDDNLISASKKENGRVDDCVKPADTKSDISAKGKKRFKIRTADIAVTAVMTALVIVFTSFIKVPIGAGGYIHLGDLMILLSASILPLPFALLSSCVGAALSDVIVGAPIWAPFSLIVKALIVLCFTAKKDKILCARNFIGCGLSCIITVVGYFFSEVIIYGNWGAYVSMPWNLVQAVVAAVGYMVIGVAFDKMKVKKFIYKK